MSDRHGQRRRRMAWIAPMRADRVVAGVAGLILFFWSILLRGDADVSPGRLPVPGAPELQKAERLVHQLYSEDYSSRLPGIRAALARKLLKTAADTRDDAAALYVLLRDAADLASSEGDVAIAMSAADAMGLAFRVNVVECKLGILTAVDRSGRDSPEALSAASSLAYAAFAGADFESAGKLASLAQNIARRSRDPFSEKAARELAAEARRVGVAGPALAKNPHDRSAAAAMGAYLCFAHGDWTKGLPLLAEGSDAILSAPAARDLKSPADPADQFELANSWWEIAQKQPLAYQNGVEAHASDWYRKAIPGLKTLPRAMAEKRAAAHPSQAAPSHDSPATAPATPFPPVEASTNRPSPAGAIPHGSLVNSVGLVFVPIPLKASGFLMGSPPGEEGRMENEQQHRVTLTRPYWMATTPVTVGQFSVFVKATGHVTYAEHRRAEKEKAGTLPDGGISTWNSPGFSQHDKHPVVSVSYDDALAFCAWLGGQDGRRYRLPTEAEWEFAARGGTQTAYFWGEDADAGNGYMNGADENYKFADQQRQPTSYFHFNDGFTFTAPVASFKPNPFGLYDMTGNVYTWCSDLYGAYPAGDAVDPTGAPESNGPVVRVMRGGSCFDGPHQCRIARRRDHGRGWASDCGFRLCLDDAEVQHKH